tara:strand:+ start:551 stop:1573 length:1023 start_codon:yes stop_codon:yes gene_type:complete
MAFVKEIPAFEPPNSSVKPLYDKLKEGDQFNSIPSDSGLLHSGGPRKHLTFREAANNSVIQHYGSYIVMGTDRLGHIGTGAGASGFTSADSVDIVVGRGQNLKPRPGSPAEVPGPAEGFIAGPLPTSDAARIYISSKTNLDKHFGIANSPRDPHVGSNKHLLSGVALKADDVRMIARNNIKIVTGRNQGYSGGKERNSLGGDSPQAGTISLIGGNYTDSETKYASLFSPNGAIQQVSYLQPAIKGDNLVECLNALFHYVDLTNATLFNAFLNAMTEKAAEIGDPLMSPISKMEKIRVAALTIPFGLEAAYENRSWALTQKRKYLEHGGDFHIRSANVYLT